MERSRWSAGVGRAGALGVLLTVAAAGALRAQATGMVTGVVVESGTRRPLVGVQVFIPGTGIGGVTNAAGRYALQAVPAGEASLRAQMVGYTDAEQAIAVVAGSTLTVDFELSQAVLVLDEVLVTGTAGQARRREVGNSIAQISGADAQAPGANAEQMLQARAPGVTVLETGAQAGSGRAIRLRGNVSVAMSNAPLIYVDGVRMRSDAYPKNRLFFDTEGSGSGSNTTASPLGDIDPNDIERIEVIKGPAATTLYGTEAAAGVIQIFTKRGSTGRPVWTLAVDQSFSKYVQPFGTEEKPYMGLDRWMSTGWDQQYSLSVAGGDEELKYYVAGSFQDTEGIFPDDWMDARAARANFSFAPVERIFADVTASFSKRMIQNVPMGNNAEGLTLNVYRLPRNYIGSSDPADIDRLFDQEWTTGVSHMIGGLTLRYQMSERLSHKLTFGYDRAENELIGMFPYGFITQPAGMRTNRRWLNETVTLDYVGTLAAGLAEELTGSFSVGAQSVATDESSVMGYSEGFPGPGDPTLTSGSNRLAFEERIRVVNAGFFGQALFGYKDRYFLTLGLRADGNSAFGEDLGLELYPKVSGSYVVSDEAFWPEGLGTLKLRAAYGHAGRAPGAFDAVRTWSPVGFAGEPAFWPNTVGNPTLGPERTSEIEVGFDGAFLGNRVGLDVTYYRQTTEDALLPVQQPPSKGFLTAQLENVGVIRNSGLEVAARATLVSGESFGWDVGLNLSTNENEVVDLGSSAPFALGETGWVFPGHPAPVIYGTRLKNPDEYAEPELESGHFFGPNLPSRTVGLLNTFALPWNVELTSQIEYMGGHYIHDRASRNMASRGVWAPCQGEGKGYDLLEQGRRDELTAFERLTCGGSIPRDFFNFPADFAKLRHVTLRVPVPESLMFGASSMSVSVSVRNIRLWKHEDLPLFDPEMAGNSGAASAVRAIVENVPTPSSLAISLRATF